MHMYTHKHIHTHASKNGKLVTTMVKKIVTVTFCQPVTTFHEVEVSHINLVVKLLINMHAQNILRTQKAQKGPYCCVACH